jgi:DeoR/GlpR family transcriptional regulator of sugar metabolism
MVEGKRESAGSMSAESRRHAIAELLRTEGAVTVSELESRFGVSTMTARRDLAALARRGIAQRTHGGAIRPRITGPEASFDERLDTNADAKAALAREAVALLSSRETLFLDSSSTSYFVAQRILELGLEVTLLTNSLPVMHFVANQAPPNIGLVAIGGSLRMLTQSFVGPDAVDMIQGHFADRAFLSIKTLTPDGSLADADPLEAEVKRCMIAQSSEAVLLIDRSKLSGRGLVGIAPASEVKLVLAHGVRERDLAPVKAAGVAVQIVNGRRKRGR